LKQFWARETRADDLLEAWRELNRPYELNDYSGPSHGQLWTFDKGRKPVILTAVHGVRHTRSAAMGKANDANTAGLALALARALKVGCGTVARSDEQLDVNSDPQHPFKAALLAQLKPAEGSFLVDLHGMTDVHGVDVAVGVGADPDARTIATGERAANLLTKRGLSVDLGGTITKLNGAGPGTMTTWARAAGLVGIQIEVRQGLRSFRSPKPERVRLLAGLIDVVNDLIDRSAVT
jgi:hypothetical protein